MIANADHRATTFRTDGLIRAPIAALNDGQQRRDADLYRIHRGIRGSKRNFLLQQQTNAPSRSILSPSQLNKRLRGHRARRDIHGLSSHSSRPNFLQHTGDAKKLNTACATSHTSPDLATDQHNRRDEFKGRIPIEIISIAPTKGPNGGKSNDITNGGSPETINKSFSKLSIASDVTSSSTATEQSRSEEITKADEIFIVNKVIKSSSKSKWARLRGVLCLVDGRAIMHEVAAQPNILLTILAQTPPLDIAGYFLDHCREEAFLERDEYGRTPLHVAATHPSEESRNLIAALLDRFPEAASIQDAYGRTPLMLACSHGKEMDARAIRILIRASHNSIIAEDEDGQSALEYALLSEVSHAVFLRLQKTANASQMKKGFAKSA